ncbi:MAG: type II toxin-antitoxin system RelE/ParE family toxin [Ktedonobacteraceae bacterium]
MKILFQDRTLEKAYNNMSLLIRKYGPKRAKLLKRRLDDLEDVENLGEMHLLPQARCHELKGNRAGTLAVDLDHPYRLIFEPANDPVPRKPDGGLDWTEITVIRVLTMEDYHD